MVRRRQVDADAAAAVASFEVNETEVDGVVVRRTIKVRFWDKVAALYKALRLLGLYERDNIQQRENLSLQIVLVEPPLRPDDEPRRP
jgi:hypothetical protein